MDLVLCGPQMYQMCIRINLLISFLFCNHVLLTASSLLISDLVLLKFYINMFAIHVPGVC